MYLAGSILVVATMGLLSVLMAGSMLGKSGFDGKTIDNLVGLFLILAGVSYLWLVLEIELEMFKRLLGLVN